MKVKEKLDKFLKLLYRLAFVLLILLSCSSPGAKRITGTNNVIPDGEVMIVGKFVIDPPPEGYERKASFNVENGVGYIDFGGRSDLGGQFHMYLDKIMKPYTAKEEEVYRNWPAEMRIMAFENETFFVPLKNMKYFGIAAAYYAERNGEAEFIYVPALFPLDIRKDDEAIYIGTIKYTRDEYYYWKKVQVIDEYNQALPEFEAKFGTSVKLRKALTKYYGR